MDCQEAASTATTADIPTPPHGSSDFVPVGSSAETLPEILSPPSDEYHDHDNEHGPDHDHDQENSSGAGVLTEDLKHKIVKQVEYYFSNENLPTDKYLMNLIKKNKEGFVPILVIASFRKMKKLTTDYSLIVDALKESSLLVVSSDGKRVKRSNPLPVIEVRDPKLFTILVENLPEDHSVGNLQRIFGAVGHIKNICIHDPHAMEESKKGGKTEILISSKLHALVEYETLDAAEKAAATLNDEQDWRNGMQVKLLKQMGKYGQRRQAWRGSDAEKNGNGRSSAYVRDEEKNDLSEHHDDMPDEEDGDHIPKDKNGHRGKSRGRGRRQKHRHGTTSSVEGIEPSKPPPGPRMPDGTRGFTMGRGRPPVSNQR
ncbi:hypothetical protein SLA2020_320460 [Shorea laevis]